MQSTKLLHDYCEILMTSRGLCMEKGTEREVITPIDCELRRHGMITDCRLSREKQCVSHNIDAVQRGTNSS